MPKTVSIFGGGPSGLTAAHYLSKLGYKVDIYERYNAVGGMARSSRDSNGCATEYCWRVYFGFYDNLLKVLSEIKTNNGVVKDNLTQYKHENFPGSSIFNFTRGSINEILKGVTSCDDRLAEMDNLPWNQAMGVSEGSALFRQIGPWLGMDRKKGSYNSVIRVGFEMQILPAFLSFGKYKDFVMNQPTSEGWFDWWVRDLESRGVTIHLNSSVERLITSGNEIAGAIVNGKLIDSDYYILSLPVQSLDIVAKASGLFTSSIRNDISLLANKCLHLQLSFQVYFNREISLGGKNAFLLVNSPWDLIVMRYGGGSSPSDVAPCIDLPDVKDGWSIAVCTAYVKGMNGKTFNECTFEEIKKEIFNQLLNSKELLECISDNNGGLKFNRSLVVEWAPMWPTFSEDPSPDENNETRFMNIKTTEPKFTNNAGSLALRPSYKTEYKNLYIATAYIKETIDIFSMEAACIAGKHAAHAIDRRSPKPTIRDRPAYLAPFRAVDSVLYNLGLPNIAFWIVILIAIITIGWAVWWLRTRDSRKKR